VNDTCTIVFDQDDNVIEIQGVLPDRMGVKVHRQLSPTEMVFLSKKYSVEFGLAQKKKLVGWLDDLLTPTWQDGDYWLFSATESDPRGISVPYQSSLDEYWHNIYHTHLNAKTSPSGSDILDLETRWWQKTSGIIAVGVLPTEVVVFDEDTSPSDEIV
jgi:proteasome lid subunit RPN8/RPN11